MRKKRILAALCALLFAFPAVAGRARAEQAESAWWEADIWGTEQLVGLGALPPVYSAAAQQYEISTPEQLLYLSGTWKPDDANGDGAPDAPCDGLYVLTADLDMAPLMERIGKALSQLSGEKIDGYMPPIGASTDETREGGVSCAFFGTFDGNGHAISNLNIVRMHDKYAGLFGNVGHDFGEGFVKNLALVNISVRCLASAGLLVGGLYGDVDNCVAIGTLDCVEKTAGGLAGKVKKNENGYLGTVRNCFVYADILVRGEGGENGAAGGVTSAQSDGGRVYNCYVGGSIKVLGEKAESVGGISGNLKAGQALENCVMLLSAIDVADGTSVGLLCGDYSGETGSHLVNNYVWTGTRLAGHVSNDHPETAAYADADAAAILSKPFYTGRLGWDFDSLWTWVGADDAGYPMLRQFTGRGGEIENLAERIQGDLVVAEPVLRPSEPMTNTGYEGDAVALTCTLTLPDGVSADNVTLRYGKDKDGAAFTDSVPMTDNGGGSFAAAFPETAAGVWYYCFEASAGGRTVTFPNELSECLRLELVSAAAKYTPRQVTISPGETVGTVGFNWITDAEGLAAKLLYRAAGGSEWTTAEVTEIGTGKIANNRGSVVGYSVDISGLSPDTQYEYRAVTMDGADEYVTETRTFTTLPDGKDFACMVVSDLQATTEEGYYPFLYTMETFVPEALGGADFVINLGDLTEDGSSMPQWRYMFNTLGEYFATNLNAFVAGNHEGSGDPGYTIYKAETNLPGGMDDPYIGETTGSFTVGDVCFVMLNTDPYTGLAGADVTADKAAFYEAEKAYAKQAFETSGCSWRIIAAHAGLIQDDPWATAFLEQMCDELDVDLYFNGHIHNYYRATARGGKIAEVGSGTTFITTSPMGCKFDDFETGVIDDLLQFQTGGSGDERQYFTFVTADSGGLTVTAYQLAAAGDIAKQKTFAEYTVIDTVTLSKSLSNQRAAAAAPTAAEPAASAEEAASGGGFAWRIAGAACAAVLIAAGTVWIVRRRRRNKA